MREHYALTLRSWVRNLEAEWDRAVRSPSPGRARVWRLYMAGSALGFERNRIGVNQVLAVRPGAGGPSGMPPSGTGWAGPDVALLAVTVIGRDRPGIIADTTGLLADLGANLEDSSMTLLRGHFAMVLVATPRRPRPRPRRRWRR